MCSNSFRKHDHVKAWRGQERPIFFVVIVVLRVFLISICLRYIIHSSLGICTYTHHILVIFTPLCHPRIFPHTQITFPFPQSLPPCWKIMESRTCLNSDVYWDRLGSCVMEQEQSLKRCEWLDF